MPDWITHIAVAYTLCTILGFKYKQFNTANTVIAMVGSILPDLVKVGLVGEYFGFGIWNFLWPIHLPVGSLIIAGIISLLFQNKKTTFLFLSLGVATHYVLDMLNYNVSGGMALLYPFYWGQWQFHLISTDNFYLPLAALLLALIVYLISRWKYQSDHKVSAD